MANEKKRAPKYTAAKAKLPAPGYRPSPKMPAGLKKASAAK